MARGGCSTFMVISVCFVISKNFLGRWIDQNRAVHVDRQFNLLVHLRDVMRLQFRYHAAAAQSERRVSPRSGWLQQFNDGGMARQSGARITGMGSVQVFRPQTQDD